MATTAREALNLIAQGKGHFEEMEHADPITDATVRWVVLDTGEAVDLGEIRPFPGKAIIPGTLRFWSSDTPPLLESTRPMRPPQYASARIEFLLE